MTNKSYNNDIRYSIASLPYPKPIPRMRDGREGLGKGLVDVLLGARLPADGYLPIAARESAER